MISLQSMASTSAKTNELLQSSQMRLASGKRINSAKDDAAGSAIVARFEALNREFQAGVRNANDGVSMLNVADSATGSVQDSLQRLRELSMQSANGILSDQDREIIDLEAQQLKSEINRVMDTTEFNGRKVLGEDGNVNIQLTSLSQTNVKTVDLASSFENDGFNEISLGTQEGASNALSSIDALLEKTSSLRAEFGASSNRLASSISNLEDQSASISFSQSRIQDTDYALEVANLSRESFLEKANIAMQTQANASKGQVLSLLLKQ